MFRKIIVAAFCTVVCAPSFAQAPAPNTAAAAQRDLWLAAEGRYVRTWSVLSPLGAAEADALARTGAPTSLSDDSSSAAWRTHISYGDVIDAFAGGAMKDGSVGFALATVDWHQAGEAQLLLGGNVRGVWVNGTWNGGAPNSPAFVIDGTRVEVKLGKGANRILLRVERLDRPVLVSMRVVTPGFVAVRPVISPYLVADGAKLTLFPGTDPKPPNPLVKYEVFAPGGRRVMDTAPPLDRPATIDTTSWASGPYEIRASATDAFGRPVSVYLPYFKGDARAAARRVIDAASAPGADGHVKMLGDMLRDRLGADGDGEVSRLHSPLLEYAELELERAGQTGGARAGGFVRLAWTDDVDGSTQFCRAYLPATYPANRKIPALLFLHGYNPPNPPYVRWWSVADRHNGVAERHEILVLEPMARGNSMYRMLGETDVLRCLAEAQRRFPVDADRVYLTGESMGGNGTWLIASRNPHLFAAAAPVFGGWDYRILGNGFGWLNPQATRPMEHFMQEAQSSFAGAEGLLNVPLYALHGDADPVVPVDFTRHGVKLLQRWGYDIRYREIPGRAHEDLRARDEIAEWLLTHRRDHAPPEVRLRSYDLAGAQAHWVRVTGSLSPLEMIEARAQVIDELVLRLDTKNVSSITLTPPAGRPLGNLQFRAPGWTVIWNGERHLVATRADGILELAAAGVEPAPGDKSPALEGRLSDFFNTPFAIVVGTGGDSARRNAFEAKAQALIESWQRWQHVMPRVFHDVEITPEIEKKYSLLLLGGAADNKVSARLASKLPLSVARDSVTVDGRKFAANDAVAQMVYPHPGNSGRYLLLVEPTSIAGLRFWNPDTYRHPAYNFPLLYWDWTIVDGRRVPLAQGLQPDRGWIAAGSFDRHWRRDDRFTVIGDAGARERAPLRIVPATPPKLPVAQLAAFAGRYVANPGQPAAGAPVEVIVDGETLAIAYPGTGTRFALEAETPTDFAIVGTGASVRFLVDGAGQTTGVVLDTADGDLVATKRAP
ncbi:MAG: prolyl oligopeptidase family serine peptidase [Steroidobacteraceae bacterium]|nr:prolyl oligopeptidase family serine peptidase [Steroidobacteraceae bacterium]